MNLVQLRHLLALAEQGSFSRAASSVHLSQPAFSRSIQALESELGLLLVDRIGRRLEITAAGHAVLDRARQIVFDAAELRHIAERMAGGLAGRLNVGLGSGPGAVLAAPLMAHFARQHPKVNLSVTRAPTDALLRSLRARDLDALVVDVLSTKSASDLRLENLAPMRAGFLCRAGHPLARRRKLTFEHLLKHPIASSPLSDQVARGLVALYGTRAHPETMLTLTCNDLQGARDAALGSDAIYLGILASARAQIAAGQMVQLNVTPALTQQAHFALVTLQARADPPLLPVLRRLVAQMMTDA